MACLGARRSLAHRESPPPARRAPTDNGYWQRLLFDSRARAVAHGDASLPSVHSQSEVLALIEYLDTVFASTPSQHSFIGSPYPAIAWSVNQVLAEQADSDAGRPLPPVRYLDRPLHLSNLRDSAIGWDTVVCRIHGIANAQREQAADSHQDAVALRGRLDVVESHLNDMHEALHRLLRGQERAIGDETEGSDSGDL